MLAALREDRYDWVRRRAAQALGALGNARAVAPLLATLREDGDEDVRALVAEALEAFLDHRDWFPPLNPPSDSTTQTPHHS